MPIYEYTCPVCGKFEKMQKITAEPLAVCPDCGSEVQRVIGPVGIHFKGSGFYSTDKAGKNALRKMNDERQKDNQAILDGDIKGYNQQAKETDNKIAEVKSS